MKNYIITNVVLLSVLAGLQVGCTATNNAEENLQVKHKDNLTQAEEKHGVRVISVRPTAANYMLDFRYKILDKNKVAELMDRKIRPQLLVEKNGATLMVPVTSKLGPLRQSAKFAKENKTYFMFFANPGRLVKMGDLVTVTIGSFKKEHIIVQ